MSPRSPYLYPRSSGSISSHHYAWLLNTDLKDQIQIPKFARQALYCWSHPWPLSSSLWFASLMSRTFCLFPSEYWLPLRRAGFIGFRKFILRKDQGETNHAIWSIYKKNIPYSVMMSNFRKWEKGWSTGSNTLAFVLTMSWPWTTLPSECSVTSPGSVTTETFFFFFCRVYLHSAQDFPVLANPPQVLSFLKSEYSDCQRSRIFSVSLIAPEKWVSGKVAGSFIAPSHTVPLLLSWYWDSEVSSKVAHLQISEGATSEWSRRPQRLHSSRGTS